MAAALITGCSNIRNEPVTSEDISQTAVRVHQSNLSDQEKQAFDEAKQRADNADYDVTGKTVGQIIADQQAYDADQKAQAAKAARLAAEVKQRHDAEVAAITHALTIAFVSKGFQPADWTNSEYNSFVTLELALKNNTNKAIRAVKGTLNFQTLLGDTIYSSGFTDEDSIAPSKSVEWAGTIKYNQFDDALTRFRNAEVRNIRMKWEPKEVLFADGSRLRVSTQ